MTWRNMAATVTVLALLATGCATTMWGQEVANAQISGVVTDPSGAAVPGSTVTATQTDKGQVRTTLSGADGAYVLPNLPVGPYRLEVQHAGFEAYTQSGILLEVSNNVSVNVTLRVGQATQRVEVSANATMMQTQTTSVSTVINQQDIVELPLNGRVPTQLLMIAGAANDVGPANSSKFADLVGSKEYFDSDDISVAGGQANGTNYLLDGGDNVDHFTTINLPFPFPDAIQEFSVQTNSLSARYGVTSGGVMNVVTKSGTDRFHGDAFEFVRNGDFDARDFFAATQDTLRRNQFGGTIGGPVLKEKVFGFFGYQGTRIRTAPPSNIAYVPTQAALNGDFSPLESAACQSSGVARTIINPSTGQPFPNDQVPTSMFNQQALNLLKYIPVSSNPCGELTYSIPNPQGENQYIGRMDWNQSSKNSVFGRYFYSHYNSPPIFDNDLLNASLRGVTDLSQSMVLGDTYSLTPNMINAVHLTWTRLGIRRGPADDPTLSSLGVNTFTSTPDVIYTSISGHFTVGCGTCAIAYFPRNAAQIADDFDIVRGRHHLSAGADWVHIQFAQRNYNDANGEPSFNGSFTNDALLDFMLGHDSSWTQSGQVRGYYKQDYIGSYVDDSIQLNKRLTVRLGLRWEPYLPEAETNHPPVNNHFFPAAFAAGTKTSQFVNAPPGIFFPGDPGMPQALSFSRFTDFSPRLGVTWDPTGSGRQTLRAGYGRFYDSPQMEYPIDQETNSPYASKVSLSAPPGGLTNPWQGYPDGDPFPLPWPPDSTAPFVTQASFFNYSINARPTHLDQWDLSYERQLANNWLLTLTYVGNKSTHIWTEEEANPAVYIPGTCNGAACSTLANTSKRRVLYLENPAAGIYYASMPEQDDGGNAEYNGLLVSMQHRFSAHYTLLGNYTYSHCISEGDFESSPSSGQTQNPYDRDGERGNCGFDLRHIFNLSFVAQSPRFNNPWTNRFLGNWQLAPIFAVHSGEWFTPWTGYDASLTGVNNDRPNVVGSPYTRNTSTLQWLNASAFVANTPGQYGDAGSQSLVGPGYFDIDAAVTRYFNIKEKQRLELRFEFFNLTNHVNFSTPDNTRTDSTFGKILSDVSPRILQFAARYTF